MIWGAVVSALVALEWTSLELTYYWRNRHREICTINNYVHVLMRDERRKEERRKQGQTNKAKQHMYILVHTCIHDISLAHSGTDTGRNVQSNHKLHVHVHIMYVHVHTMYMHIN